MRNPEDSADISAEQRLYDIAMECDVAVARNEGETLADFAQAVKDAIADKIVDINGCIREIEELDLDEEAQDIG